jgi:hypothetical protein
MLSLDLSLDDRPWKDLESLAAEGRVVELGPETEIGLLVLDKAMASGADAVRFRVPLPDGRVVVFQTSIRLLGAALRALETRRPAPDITGPPH